MKATLLREASADEGTFGELTLENGWTCRTAELPWRYNQRGASCVPVGDYSAHVVQSPHLQRMVYLLENVPGRQEIEIHNGNFAGDSSKGFASQVHGCILVGREVAIMGSQRGVTSSRATLSQLLEQTGGEALQLSIRDAP